MAEQPKSNGGVGADLSNTPNFDNAGKDVVKEVDYSSAGAEKERIVEEVREAIRSHIAGNYNRLKGNFLGKVGQGKSREYSLEWLVDSLVATLRLQAEDSLRPIIDKEWMENNWDDHKQLLFRHLSRVDADEIAKDYVYSMLFDKNGEPTDDLREFVFTTFMPDIRKGYEPQYSREEYKKYIPESFSKNQKAKVLKYVDELYDVLESHPQDSQSDVVPEPPQSADNAQPSQTESEIGADLANIPPTPEAGADVSDVPEPPQSAEASQPSMPSESQAPAQEPADAIGQEVDDQVKSFLDSIYGEAVKYATAKKTRKDSFDSFISDLPFYLTTALVKRKIGGKDRTERAQKYILSRYFDEHGEPTKELGKLIEEVQPIWPNGDVEYDVETFKTQIPGWFGTDAKDKAIRLFREYANAQRENGTAPSAPSTPSPNDNPSPSQNPAKENPGSSTKIPDFLDFAYFKENLGYEPFDITKMKGEPEYGEKEATPEHEDNRKQTQAFVESFLEANPFASNRRIRQEARKHGVDITATKWVDAVRNKIAETTGFSPTPAQQQIGDAMYSLMDSITADDETRSQYILDLEAQGAIYDRQPTKAGFFDRVFKSSGYNKRKEAVEQEYVQRTQEENNLISDIQAAAAKGDVKEVERLHKELKDLQKEISNLNVTFQRLNQGFKDFDTPKEKADDYADKAKALMEELKNGIDSLTGQWVSDKPMSPELEAYVRTDDDEKRRRILGGTKGRDRQNEDERIAQYIANEEQRKEGQKFKKKAEDAYRQYRHAQRGEKIGSGIGKPVSWLGKPLDWVGKKVAGAGDSIFKAITNDFTNLGGFVGGGAGLPAQAAVASGGGRLLSLIGKGFSKAPTAFGKAGGVIGSTIGRGVGAMSSSAAAIAGPVGAILAAIGVVVSVIKMGIRTVDAAVQKAFQSAPFNGRIAAAKMQYEGEEFSRKQRFASGTEESSTELIEAWSDLKEESQDMVIAFANLKNTLLTGLVAFAQYSASLLKMAGQIMGMNQLLPKVMSVLSKAVSIIQNSKGAFEEIKDNREYEKEQDAQAGRLQQELALIKAGNLARKYFETGEFDEDAFNGSSYAKAGYTKEKMIAALNDENRRDEFEDAIAFNDVKRGGDFFQGYRNLSGEAPTSKEDLRDVLKTLQSSYVQQVMANEHQAEIQKNTEETAKNTRKDEEKLASIGEGPLWDALMRSANKYKPTGAETPNDAEWGEPSRQYGRFAAEGARQQNWGRR